MTTAGLTGLVGMLFTYYLFPLMVRGLLAALKLILIDFTIVQAVCKSKNCRYLIDGAAFLVLSPQSLEFNLTFLLALAGYLASLEFTQKPSSKPSLVFHC